MLKHFRRLMFGLICAGMTSTAGLVLAHGDDHKDHAHAAPSTVLETARAVPTLRAESEQFELVARLYPDELGIYIDQWASNAPLLNATVEVELNGKKAIATFHADHGDYAVADADFLKALQVEGEHALIFSIEAGKDADLLTGTLHVHAEDGLQAIQQLASKPGLWVMVGGFALILLLGCGLGIRHLLSARKENQL